MSIAFAEFAGIESRHHGEPPMASRAAVIAPTRQRYQPRRPSSLVDQRTWRKLKSSAAALLVLTYLRKGEAFAEHANLFYDRHGLMELRQRDRSPLGRPAPRH
jgi:hypothetical protein